MVQFYRHIYLAISNLNFTKFLNYIANTVDYTRSQRHSPPTARAAQGGDIVLNRRSIN